jgi:predicted RNA polymerase sigma factor
MPPKQCIGLYQIETYIFAVNAQSSAWKQTDYAEIVTLYELMFAK